MIRYLLLDFCRAQRHPGLVRLPLVGLALFDCVCSVSTFFLEPLGLCDHVKVWRGWCGVVSRPGPVQPQLESISQRAELRDAPPCEAFSSTKIV